MWAILQKYLRVAQRAWGWENTKSDDNVHPTYLEIILPVCWNHSPTCSEVNLVTHVYRKMASCSSKVIYFKLPCPMWCNTKINSLKTYLCTPSSVRMHLGWPWRSSWTHASPDRIDVWYGCLSPCCITRKICWIVGKTRFTRIFNIWEICCWTMGPLMKDKADIVSYLG